MRWSIYTLTEPGTDAVRYVGITRVTLPVRLTRHVCDARKSGETNHRSCWLRALERQGLRPSIHLVEETDDPTRERYWITHFRVAGADLVNSSDGCESHVGYVPPASVRLAISRAKRGKKISPEHVAALVRANAGRRMSAANRAKVNAAVHARMLARTGCKYGHPFTEENTIRQANGRRECRTCRRAIKRRHNDRLKIQRRLRAAA